MLNLRIARINRCVTLAETLCLAILSLFCARSIAGDPATNESALAIKLFKIPPDLKVDLWAAEPLLANPVAFNFDEKGRAYVCETFRLHAGVDDIRELMPWLDEELASRSTEDRLAEMKRHIGAERLPFYQRNSERIRLLEDKSGSGKADRSTIFATEFNSPLDGIGAGVLVRGGDVWYANIPNLWLLRDTNADGVADSRKSLHYGFGVRVGFLGHDLHGLHFGPDGKLYFSIGDRGARVKVADDRTIGEAETGCVFRCNADGSDLEVFATGLRNPQDLVFDRYGNLFTGDNNSDSGDQARWVYLVEGGDSGWRVGYQFMDTPYSRGPFNEEKLWYPQFKGQAAYIVPPITNIASGPSGVAYFPGTGLPARYAGHFFLVDFRGASANSGIHTFTLKPKGASFSVAGHERFVWGVLATDVKFGVDGGVYLTDWVSGWEMTGKGRIYRVHDSTLDRQPSVLETKQLLAEGMKGRSISQLANLLKHPDIRIRQEAQFALAAQGSKAIKQLTRIAQSGEHQLARLHAIWGLGQILAGNTLFIDQSASQETRAISPAQRRDIFHILQKLLTVQDPEVRCQAAKVLGESKFNEASTNLAGLLKDPSPRVRFFATMSLRKLGRSDAIPAILIMLRENDDQDPYLRHAGVMALTSLNDWPALLTAARDASSAVRLGALLAMRRLHRSEISLFLKDPEPALVLEAARAVNDEPINGAMPDLAALIDSIIKTKNSTSPPVPLLRRVLNANFRLGTTNSATAIAAFSLVTNAPEPMRVEALEALADWPHPSGRDRVMGLWRPIPASRHADTAADALQPHLASLLRNQPDEIRRAALNAVSRLAISSASPMLLELTSDAKASGKIRASALETLAALDCPDFPAAFKIARSDSSEELRKAATLLEGKLKEPYASEALAATLEAGTLGERQAALTALKSLQGPAAENLVMVWLDKLLTGTADKELQLDIIEAASKRSSSLIKQKLSQYQSSKDKGDSLSEFREALAGGDAAQGKKLFFERADVQCARCHRIKDQGGDVGPDLSHVAAQKDRPYLLESIVLPNQQIATGFDSILVTCKNGEAYGGVLKSETPTELIVNSLETGQVTLKKSDIVSRKKGLSPMPEGLGQILSKRDIRDIVEYLTTLK